MGCLVPVREGRRNKKNFKKKKRKTDTIPEPEPLSSSRCLSLMSLPCNWTWWMLALFSPRTRFVLSTPSDISGPGRLFSEHNSVPVCLVKCWGLNCQLYVVMRMFLCFFFSSFLCVCNGCCRFFFFFFFFAHGCGESEWLCGVCTAWVRRCLQRGVKTQKKDDAVFVVNIGKCFERRCFECRGQFAVSRLEFNIWKRKRNCTLQETFIGVRSGNTKLFS